MKSRQKKRLAVVAAGLLVVAVLAGGFVIYRMQRIEADVAGLREQGMRFIAEGKNEQALHPLSLYLQQRQDDAEALRAFVDARLSVEEPDGQHIRQALGGLRRLAELRPDDSEVRRELVTHYDRMGFSTEVLDLVNRLTAETPADPELAEIHLRALLRLRRFEDVLSRTDAILNTPALAEDASFKAVGLRARSLALFELQRFAEALNAARAFNAAQPDDLEGHLLTVRLLQQQEGLAAGVAHAVAAQEAHPEDPQFAVLRSIALMTAGDLKGAREWASRAAGAAHGEPRMVILVSGHLENLQLFDDALQVLRLGYEKLGKEELRIALAWAYLTRGNVREAAEVLEGLDPADMRVRNDLLIFRAFALASAGQREEAGTWIERVAAHRQDAFMQSWLSVLRLLQQGEATRPAEMVQAAEQALVRDPGDPVLLQLLGAAQEARGESELALDAYRRAAVAAPNWPAPQERMARLLLNTGRSPAALEVAQSLLRLLPKQPGLAITLLDVVSANRTRLQPAQIEQLVGVAMQVWAAPAARPTVAPSVMAILVSARSSQNAQQVAKDVLADPSAYGPRTLSRVAGLANEIGLAEAESLRKLGVEAGRGTPEQAYVEALQLHESGQTDSGHMLLKEREAAIPADQKLPWMLARATYEDQAGLPVARRTFSEVLDASDDSREVARRIVQSNVAAREESLLRRAVEVLRQAGGDAGIEWRIGQARLLIEQEQETGGVARAAKLLEELINDAPLRRDAKLMLARCYEASGNVAGAVQQLQAAARLAERPHDDLLRAAAIMARQGDSTRAVTTIREVLAAGDLSAREFTQAVMALSRAGRPMDAVDVYEGAIASGTVKPDLLLARLYWQSGKLGDAERVFRDVVDEAPTAAAIESYSQFLLEQERKKDADAVIARLDVIDLPAGLAPLLRGNHYRVQGDADRAREHFREATTEFPKLELGWQALIQNELEQGDTAAAVAASKQAAEHLSQDSPVTFLARNAGAVQAVADKASLTPMVLAVQSDPSLQDVTAEALGILKRALADGRSEQGLNDLRKLADANPRYLALQVLTARQLRQAGRLAEAVEVAMRTMNAFPDAVEPAWQASEALAAADRWSEALSAAQEWRRRSSTAPLAADLAIAQAQMRLGDPARAAVAVRPYLKDALAEPDAHTPLILTAARARMASGDVRGAAEVLQPLLPLGEVWRQQWMELAVLATPDVSTAGRWMEQVAPLIEAPVEQLRLATSWKAMYDRFGLPQYGDRARTTLEPLLESAEQKTSAALLLGFLAEQTRDLASAETYYRMVLAEQPEHIVARNNLAMVLINRGGNAAEALKLAQQVVAERPEEPNYLDTLAAAELAAGQTEQATATIRRALEKQPGDPALKLRLAEALVRAGLRDEARAVVIDVRAALDGTPPSDNPLHARILDDLRDWAKRLQSSLDSLSGALPEVEDDDNLGTKAIDKVLT